MCRRTYERLHNCCSRSLARFFLSTGLSRPESIKRPIIVVHPLIALPCSAPSLLAAKRDLKARTVVTYAFPLFPLKGEKQIFMH